MRRKSVDLILLQTTNGTSTRCYAQGGSHLNQFNGHSHGDYGFHYHLTIDSSGAAAFPFGPSLNYYGCGAAGCQKSTCGSSSAKTSGSCSTGIVYPTAIPTVTPKANPIAATTIPSNIPSSSPVEALVSSSFSTSLVLTNYSAPKLDSASKTALINASASSFKIPSQFVSIVSDTLVLTSNQQTISRYNRLQLTALPNTYSINVIFSVQNPNIESISSSNASSHALIKNFQTAVVSGAFEAALQIAVINFDAYNLTKIKVGEVRYGSIEYSVVLSPTALPTSSSQISSSSSKSSSSSSLWPIIAGAGGGILILICSIAAFWRRCFMKTLSVEETSDQVETAANGKSSVNEFVWDAKLETTPKTRRDHRSSIESSVTPLPSEQSDLDRFRSLSREKEVGNVAPRSTIPVHCVSTDDYLSPLPTVISPRSPSPLPGSGRTTIAENPYHRRDNITTFGLDSTSSGNNPLDIRASRIVSKRS